MSLKYQMEARQQWDQARRRAFWSSLLADLRGKNIDLLDFNEISQRLHLRTDIYRGVQNVPLDKIVGSVGRYQDFTGAFLPLSEAMRERWEKVARVYLDPASGGVPPVELYKVGDAYFVKDGNHRVSILRQQNIPSIEAYVWEYPEPVAGLAPDADIDTLLIEAERHDFLHNTRLDDLRAKHGIRLTAPGGYTLMLRQIAHYQGALSRIDETEVSYEDTVTAWYDMVYETSVQEIEEEGILEQFPERTAADFFVWVMHHKEHLEERYHKRIMVEDAARDLKKQMRPNPLMRVWRAIKGLVMGRDTKTPM